VKNEDPIPVDKPLVAELPKLNDEEVKNVSEA
jgi:hypothetical protein